MNIHCLSCLNHQCNSKTIPSPPPLPSPSNLDEKLFSWKDDQASQHDSGADRPSRVFPYLQKNWVPSYSSLENVETQVPTISEHVVAQEEDSAETLSKAAVDKVSEASLNEDVQLPHSDSKELNAKVQYTDTLCEEGEDSNPKDTGTQEQKPLISKDTKMHSAAAKRVQNRRSFHRPKPLRYPVLQKLGSLPVSCHIPPHSLEQEETQF